MRPEMDYTLFIVLFGGGKYEYKYQLRTVGARVIGHRYCLVRCSEFDRIEKMKWIYPSGADRHESPL